MSNVTALSAGVFNEMLTSLKWASDLPDGTHELKHKPSAKFIKFKGKDNKQPDGKGMFPYVGNKIAVSLTTSDMKLGWEQATTEAKKAVFVKKDGNGYKVIFPSVLTVKKDGKDIKISAVEPEESEDSSENADE